MPNNAENKKFKFDGVTISMNINIGNVKFKNDEGSIEEYKAEKIEIKTPSEHYITDNGVTPRYDAEVQITHQLEKSSNMSITNKVFKVKKLIVSIPFIVGNHVEGDVFLNQLGISSKSFLLTLGYNINMDNAMNLAKENKDLEQKRLIVSNWSSGFNADALQGLLNILNADLHVYFYYGSRTTPPCEEDALWAVFAKPRAISKYQYLFIRNQVVKHKDPSLKIKNARTKDELYGNKREVQVKLKKIKI